MQKNREVLAWRDGDLDLVILPLGLIIFFEPFAQPVCFYTNDWISPLLKTGRAAQCFDRNGVLFDLINGPRKIMLANIIQKMNKPLGSSQEFRFQDCLAFCFFHLTIDRVAV